MLVPKLFFVFALFLAVSGATDADQLPRHGLLGIDKDWRFRRSGHGQIMIHIWNQNKGSLARLCSNL
jgi:hypothetical protein